MRTVSVTLLSFLMLAMLSGFAAAASDGFIGLYLEDLDEDMKASLDYKGDGVLVDDVVKDSPAEKAGLKAGDIIVKYNGKKIESYRQLRSLIHNTEPGKTAEVAVWRDGDTIYNKIELISREQHSDVLKKRIQSINIPKKKFLVLTGDRAFLGVDMEDLTEQLAEYFKVKHGVLVTEVYKDSPADKAGIKAGDIITRFEGKNIEESDDLSHYIGKKKTGDKVKLQVVRNGKSKSIEAELGKLEDYSQISKDLKDVEIDLRMLEEQLQQIPAIVGEAMEDFDIDVDIRTRNAD